MSGLLAGRLGLTEWAELEAHTAACEACDRALDLRYSDLFEERVGRDRPIAWAGRAAKRVGIGMAAVLVLGALGVYAYPRLPEISMTELRSLRLTALAGDLLDSLSRFALSVASGPAPSPARPAEDSRVASTSPVASAASPARLAEDSQIAPAPPAASAPAPPPARAAEDSPVASAPPLPSPPAAALSAHSPTPPQVVPSPAVAARPSVSPSAPAALPPRPATPRRPARVPEQKTTAPKAARERNVLQSPRAQDEQARASSPGPSADARTDVIAQLTVQDRQEARRDIGLLLARLGGSRMAEKDSTVWLVVPRSRYGEFARGLAQIGSSQMEQGGGALPDPVAVTVILTR